MSSSTESAPRGPFFLILSAFAAFGLMYGVWQVLLANLALDLQLSSGALGLALSGGALASIPVMLLGGRLADRLGARPVIIASALALALGLIGVSLTHAYATLVALLLLFTGGSGLYDVGINAVAVRHEQGRRDQVLSYKVLPYFHAGFSGFAALGALLSGGLLALDVPFRSLYWLAAAAMLLAALVWRGDVPAGTVPADSVNAEPGRAVSRSPFRNGAVLLLAVITLMAFFGEGAMENWSALYLRGSFGVAAGVGALGVAVFHAAMLLGRLAAGRALRVFSRRSWLMVAGLTGALGTVLTTVSGSVAVTVAGLLLVGLGLAAVAPTAFSLAGDAAPRAVGTATATITTIGYFGFLAGPSIIGGVAQLSSLRFALALVGVASLVILGLAWRVREKPI